MRKLIILILLLLVNTVAAQTLEISLDKTNYKNNDNIRVEILLRNDDNLIKTFNVESGLLAKGITIFIDRSRKTVELNPNEEKKIDFSFMINDLYESGEYDVVVNLFDENNNKIKEEKKDITIINAERPGKITKQFPYSLIIILFLSIGIITTFVVYRSKIKELLILAKQYKLKPKDELSQAGEYIKDRSREGHSKEDIKQALKEAGWQEENIEEAFRRIK